MKLTNSTNSLVAVVFVLSSLLVFSGVAEAGSKQEFKGKGRVSYKSRKPSPADRQKAVDKAMFNALDTYVSDLSEAQSMNFYDLEDDIMEKLDRYVTGYDVIDDKVDKDSKTYTVLIMAEVNTRRLEIFLTKKGGGGDWHAGESYISFVFTTRDQSSVKTFDQKRLTRRDNDVVEDIDETLAGDGQSAVSSTSLKTSSVEVTGGSTTRKGPKVTYARGSSQELKGVVSGVFKSSKFKVVDSAQTGVQESWFADDYSQGQDISQATRKMAFDTFQEFARSKDINGTLYFAYGVLEVGVPDLDPSSGMTIITVTVNAEIFDVSGPLYETVASVGGHTYTQRGRDADNARKAALKLASQKASKELINQLMSQNIR